MRGCANPEWTREEFARAVTFDKLPSRLRQKISSRKRGPQKAQRKVPVSIRLSPDVVEAFRASGAGWQARVDEILPRNAISGLKARGKAL